ncbi:MULTISPECIES: class I SAM-dependent methyltransferase [Bacillaceae]|nr:MULTISPECIES: class I SAM-dependent methyltransferase [Bacillaceae]
MRFIRKKKDVGIYGFTAKWYDKNTRKSRLSEMHGYADIVSNHVENGGSVLEVAPGPGYLSIELSKRGYSVTGVEISQDFVDIEKKNAIEFGVDIDFKQGNASKLPCFDEMFDFVICSAAFKNFKEPVKALCEMQRVLKPGGKALIIDMNRALTSADIEREIIKLGMKGFDRWFVKLAFKTFLRQSAYTIDAFEGLIAQTTFNRHEIKKDGISLFVWLYK